MIRVKLTDLPVGTRLAHNVLNSFGQLLLLKGTVLEASHRQRLLHQGIDYVFLQEAQPIHYTPPDPGKAKMDEYFSLGSAVIKEVVDRVKTGGPIDLARADEVVDLILPQLVTIDHNKLLSFLLKLKQKDEYTLGHSISVSTISMLIGRFLGYSEGDLKQLGMAGLLHDLGKYMIPDQIINKPDSLTETEFQEIQKHPVHGYRLLRSSSRQLSNDVVQAVLQHHERFDGNGYPFRLPYDQIHEFARIIAVADIFDAITSERVYRPRASIFQAAEEVLKSCFGQIDPEIGLKFLNYLGNQCVGKAVRLNTGEVGEVVIYHANEPARPLVRVGNQFVDLRQKRSQSIVEVMS